MVTYPETSDMIAEECLEKVSDVAIESMFITRLNQYNKDWNQNCVCSMSQ